MLQELSDYLNVQEIEIQNRYLHYSQKYSCGRVFLEMRLVRCFWTPAISATSFKRRGRNSLVKRALMDECIVATFSVEIYKGREMICHSQVIG